jgi:hypothetical protein
MRCYAVVIEIKSTDWDALRDCRVRPNSQAAGFLRNLGLGQRHPALPRRPINFTRLRLIDDLTSREAIMAAWYDETNCAVATA